MPFNQNCVPRDYYCNVNRCILIRRALRWIIIVMIVFNQKEKKNGAPMDLTEERKKQEFDKYNVNTIKKKKT